MFLGGGIFEIHLQLNNNGNNIHKSFCVIFIRLRVLKEINVNASGICLSYIYIYMWV